MADDETNAEDQGHAPDAHTESMIDFTAMPWESPAPGLRVKQVCRGNQRIRLIEFGEDFVEADWCTTGHIGYVVEGAFEIDFSGRVVRYRAGDGLCIPPGEPTKHKANVPNGKALLFVVEHSEHE